jgi:hypothetical protein
MNEGTVTTSRIQIKLDPETQRRARQRASETGVSLAEYVRRLVERDLIRSQPAANSAAIFDLGDSGGSDIANRKDAMLGGAFASPRQKSRR